MAQSLEIKITIVCRDKFPEPSNPETASDEWGEAMNKMADIAIKALGYRNREQIVEITTASRVGPKADVSEAKR